MGIVFRQSAKSSIVTGMGAILGAAIMWLSTQYIGKREFGFIGNFTNYAVTLSQILLLGLNSTLVVYIHRFSQDEKKRKLLITWCFALPGVILVLTSIVYFSLRSWILHHFQPADQPLMERYFVWLPIFTLLFIYMVIFEQYLGSQLKVAISAFMREVVLRIATMALILLFGFGYVSFNTLVIGTILLYLLPVFIMLFLVSRTKDFGLSRKTSDFSPAEYKEMAHFSWYHFLLSASMLLIGYLDALLLPFYDHQGFSAVAVYRVAVFLISFMILPMKAMIPASFTVLAKAFADNDLAKAGDLFLRSSINILIATVCISLLLYCNLPNLVLVMNEGYEDIIPVFLILFAGNIVNVATGMNDQVLSITNYYKFNFYVSISLLVVLFVLIRTLVPQYSIYGAAWSTTITLIVFNAVKCYYVWIKIKILPFSSNTLLVLAAAVPALAAGYFFPHFFDMTRHGETEAIMDNGIRNAILDTGIRSTLIVAIYFVMLLWLKPSQDMVEYISSVRKNKRLF